MNTWDTISTHNDVYKEDMQRKEKEFLAQVDNNLPNDESPSTLATLTGAIRRRLSKAQNSQPTAPQTHGSKIVQA